MVSNLGEGAAVVRAMNALGYHASAVGNHEFDYGPVGPASVARQAGEDARGALRARAQEARFPLLAANVIDGASGQPVAWPNVKSSILVEVGGVRVGIVGGTSERTPISTNALNLRGEARPPQVPEPFRSQATQGGGTY